MSGARFPHLPAEGWELYLRDELDGAALRSVESHLEDCAACRRALEQADPSSLFRRLRAAQPKESALEGLAESVLAEIAAQPAAPASQRRERFALLAGAATLVLAVLTLQALPIATPSPQQALAQPDSCVRFALSSDECRDLFLEVDFHESEALIVETSADLSELL